VATQSASKAAWGSRPKLAIAALALGLALLACWLWLRRSLG